jgi:hypothetical protein
VALTVGLDFVSAESADGPSSFLPSQSQALPFNITFQYCHSAFSILPLTYSISPLSYPAETWAFSRHDENAATQGRRPTGTESQAPLA